MLAPSWILDGDPRQIDLLLARSFGDRLRVADEHGFHDPLRRQAAHSAEDSRITGLGEHDPFGMFSGPIEDLP